MLVVYNGGSYDATRAAGALWALLGSSNKFLAMNSKAWMEPVLVKAHAGLDIEIAWIIGLCPRDPLWLYGMTKLFATVNFLSLTKAGDETVAYLESRGLRQLSLYRAPRASSLFDMVLSRCPGLPVPRLLSTDELALSGIDCCIQSNPLLWEQLRTPLSKDQSDRLAHIYQAISWNMDHAPVYWISTHLGRFLCMEIPDPSVANDIGPCWQRLAKELHSRYGYHSIGIGFKNALSPDYSAFLFGRLSERAYLEMLPDSRYEKAVCVLEEQWEGWKRELASFK